MGASTLASGSLKDAAQGVEDKRNATGRRLLSELIGRGIDMMSRDENGNTPLLWALREYAAAARNRDASSSPQIAQGSRFVSLSAAFGKGGVAASDARISNLKALAVALLGDDDPATAINNDGWGALHYVACMPSAEDASEFMGVLSAPNGAHLCHVRDQKGRTPLLLAIANGSAEIALAMTSKYGINPRLGQTSSRDPNSGADNNDNNDNNDGDGDCGMQQPSIHVDKSGQNLLHAIASHSWENCNYRVLKELIDAVGGDERTDRLAVDSFGRTPLFLAHRRIKTPVIMALFAGLYAASSAAHANGTPALFDAVRNDNHVSVKHLMGFKTGARYIRDSKNRSALFFARSLAMIKLLYDAGMRDLRILDTTTGRTALHAMVSAGGDFGEENVRDVVQFLFESDGGAFELKDNDGNVCLHVATTREFAAALLSVCLSLVHVANSAGRTPAHLFLLRGSFDCFVECKRAGANLLALDNEGKSAMAIASLETLCALLMNSSAEDTASYLEKCKLSDLVRPLNSGSGGDGRTLLHAVCAYDRRLLTPTPTVNKSFDFVNVDDAQGYASPIASTKSSLEGLSVEERRRMSVDDTLSASRGTLRGGNLSVSQVRPRLGTAPAASLMSVSAGGSSSSSEYAAAEKPRRDLMSTKTGLIMSLVAMGFPVDARDARGRTSLRESADRGDTEVCRALCLSGADPDALADDGRSPRLISVFSATERPELAELLSPYNEAARQSRASATAENSAAALSQKPVANDGHGPLPSLTVHEIESKRTETKRQLEQLRRSRDANDSGEHAHAHAVQEHTDVVDAVCASVYTHVWPSGDVHKGNWRYGLLHGDGLHLYCESENENASASVDMAASVDSIGGDQSLNASVTSSAAGGSGDARAYAREASVASARSEFNPFDEGESADMPDSPAPIRIARRSTARRGAEAAKEEAQRMCLCSVAVTSRNSVCFRGRWIDGFRHGAGVVTWPDGRMELREYNMGVLVTARAMDDADGANFDALSRVAALEAALAAANLTKDVLLAKMNATHAAELAAKDTEYSDRLRSMESAFSAKMEGEMRMRAQFEEELKSKMECVEEERETMKDTFQLALEIQKREVEKTRADYDAAVMEASEAQGRAEVERRLALDALRMELEAEKMPLLERIAFLEKSCEDFVKAQEMFMIESDARETEKLDALRKETEARIEAITANHVSEVDNLRHLCERQVLRVKEDYRGRVELQERERLLNELSLAEQALSEFKAEAETHLEVARAQSQRTIDELTAAAERDVAAIRRELDSALNRLSIAHEENARVASSHAVEISGLKASITQLRNDLTTFQDVSQRLEADVAARQRDVAMLKDTLGRLEGTAIEGLSLDELRCLSDSIKEHRRAVNRALIIAEEEERRRAMPAQTDVDASANTCAICFERPLDTILRPCNHAFCNHCADVMSSCPKCRGRVHAREHIYLN
eukprot:Opistho-2@82825